MHVSLQMLPLKANIAMQLWPYCSTRAGSRELAQSREGRFEAWELRAWSGVQRSKLSVVPVPGTGFVHFAQHEP